MDEGSRRLKLGKLKEELNQLYHQYAAMHSERNDLNSKLGLVMYQKKIAKQSQKRKYSFLERVFTKRKAYRADQTILRSLDSIEREYIILKKRVIEAEERVFDKVKASGIEEKIEKLENEIKTLEKEVQNEGSNECTQGKRLTTFKVDNFVRGKIGNDQETGTICGQ